MTDPAIRQPTIRQVLARGHLRLVLFAVALAAASLTVTGAVLLRGFAQHNLDLTVRTVSYAVEPAMFFKDRDAVFNAVRSVSVASSARRIEVLDTGGRPIAVWQPDPGDGTSWEHAISRFIWPEPAVAPVAGPDRALGTVRVYGSAAEVIRYALSGLIIGLCCLAITVLATRMLARKLDQEVVAPLEHVAEVSRAVRLDRRFDRRIEPSAIAEIDRFTQDFNSLLGELQGWQHSMLSENKALAHRAEHDPLTGLGNRALFERQLDLSIDHAGRSGQALGLFFLDLDGFKDVNDQLGHEVGDRVLKEVGRRLLDSLRAPDKAYRLGGDEFAILMTSPKPDLGADAVIERINRAFTPPVTIANDTEVDIGVSIGAASYPYEAADSQSLRVLADQRMYYDKRRRKIDA